MVEADGVPPRTEDWGDLDSDKSSRTYVFEVSDSAKEFFAARISRYVFPSFCEFLPRERGPFFTLFKDLQAKPSSLVSCLFLQ